MGKRIDPPACPTCAIPATLTVGSALRLPRALAEKPYWHCFVCGAYCSCRHGTKQPLGLPAGLETRRARGILAERLIDPLWRTAHLCEAYDRRFPHDNKGVKMIQNAARTRVYKWLADQLGIEFDPQLVELLDLEMCRKAWRALSGVDYPSIRLWAKMRENYEPSNVIPFKRKGVAA